MKPFGVLSRIFFALGLLAISATLAQAATAVHWYGHAAFRIDTPSGGVILIDPFLKAPTNQDKDSIDKLTRVDYILVTHGHWDHIGDAVEIAKKTGATLVTSYGLHFNLKSVLGYPEQQASIVTGGNVGGTVDLPKAGAKVTFTSAVHGSELVPPAYKAAPGQAAALASGNPLGYVLQIKDGPTIYHTGDTDVFSDMKLIPEFFKIDLMLAAIGGHFVMDPVRAALAVEWVNPKQVVPMHFGTFPVLVGTPAQFKAALDKRSPGLGSRMLEMKPGETRTF
jgi:L-ascorbate metabolism protein UlaG (beta-lactamase superfamily)